LGEGGPVAASYGSASHPSLAKREAVRVQLRSLLFSGNQARELLDPGIIMTTRPPNYSHDRSQRERAQNAKNDAKAQRRAEKSARRKAAKGEAEPLPDADQPERKL